MPSLRSTADRLTWVLETLRFQENSGKIIFISQITAGLCWGINIPEISGFKKSPLSNDLVPLQCCIVVSKSWH